MRTRQAVSSKLRSDRIVASSSLIRFWMSELKRKSLMRKPRPYEKSRHHGGIKHPGAFWHSTQILHTTSIPQPFPPPPPGDSPCLLDLNALSSAVSVLCFPPLRCIF